MIELKDITKKFDRLILNKICLKLEKGNIYVIKGISGSGKTTLLNILSFLDTDYSGDYLWNGQNVKNISAEKKEEYFNKVSYVFQKSFLFRGLTIKENLLFIKNDIELIEKYSNMFHISSLLDKKPEEISGGERQRVALVRALILDSEVILLDEPTSSLDKENSLLFVSYLEKLKLENKIIVISTHKEIYDDLSDTIYHLDYGVLKTIKESKNEKKANENFKDIKKSYSTFKYDLLFVKKRKKKRVALLIFMVLFFLLLFSFVSILKNIKKEVVNQFSEVYPLHVFSISEYDSKRVDQQIQKVYYNYKLEYDNYSAYILLDREDSVLKDKAILQYGSFPDGDNEVLVNEEFIINNLDFTDYDDALNSTIVVENEEFIISGIVFNDNSPYLSNYFYREIDAINKDYITPVVFIPYEKMKNIGYIAYDEKEVVITIDKDEAIDIYTNSEEFTNRNGDFSYSLTWGNEVRNAYSAIYNYVKIGLLIGGLLAIFTFIFMIGKVSLELYYQKKEIGYLQLYRVSKDRIHMIFLMNYLLEIILAFIVAIILFNIFCFIIYHIYGLYFFLSFFYWILFIIISFIYFYTLITVPVMKYLKKDILDCIKESWLYS